jgi:hypothetical protein
VHELQNQRRKFMIRIARALPGEIEGNLDPEDYGFEVIKEEPPDDEEAAERVGRLYAQVKERTGLMIPELEPCLAAVPSHGTDAESMTTEGSGDPIE